MAGLLDLVDHLAVELKRLDMSPDWTISLEEALAAFLDQVDPLDAELLRLKVAGTAVEPLMNARALLHEIRRALGHQDATGKMVKLERPAGDPEVDDDAETNPGP